MKISTLSIHPYQIPLTNGQIRSGALICITNEAQNRSWGEVAPLPKWSQETLDQSLDQIDCHRQRLQEINWSIDNWQEALAELSLYPSVVFGLESALLALLDPLPAHTIPTSALFMGSAQEILAQAKLRYQEGFSSAKLKVNQLSFAEAEQVIRSLKDRFHLRIDVNRAWDASDALDFFSQFSKNTFDYVEEPFKNPQDLPRFTHPLAIDESCLSLNQLKALPTLKTLVYKPTVRGGILGCLPLLDWTKKNNVSLVLSSSFESDIGLASIASMAYRLGLTSPIGIGTYHYMPHSSLQFIQDKVRIP